MYFCRFLFLFKWISLFPRNGTKLVVTTNVVRLVDMEWWMDVMSHKCRAVWSYTHCVVLGEGMVWVWGTLTHYTKGTLRAMFRAPPHAFVMDFCYLFFHLFLWFRQSMIHFYKWYYILYLTLRKCHKKK